MARTLGGTEICFNGVPARFLHPQTLLPINTNQEIADLMGEKNWTSLICPEGLSPTNVNQQCVLTCEDFFREKALTVICPHTGERCIQAGWGDGTRMTSRKMGIVDINELVQYSS